MSAVPPPLLIPLALLLTAAEHQLPCGETTPHPPASTLSLPSAASPPTFAHDVGAPPATLVNRWAYGYHRILASEKGWGVDRRRSGQELRS